MNRATLLLLLLGMAPGCALFKKKAPEAAVDVATTDAAVDAQGQPVDAEPVVPQWTEETITQAVNDAAALLTTNQESHAREAIEALKQVQPEAPQLAEIPYNLGVAYRIIGEDNQARKYFLSATEIDPSLGSAWMNLGAMAERQGELARALQNYKAGLKYDPENPDLIVGEIGVLRKMGRDEEAIVQAKQALQRNANNINAYNNLGLVYMDQGKYDLALFIYLRAQQFIDGADGNALIHTNLGRIYLHQEKPGLARVELEKALELDPNLVAARMFLAQIYMDRRDWDQVVELLEKAKDLEPDNAAIRVNLGIAYRGQGKYDLAKRSYERALDLDPDNLDPYLDMAVLLGDHMKEYDKALEAIQTYIDQGGSRVELAQEWMAEVQADKAKARKQAERKKRQEEARKKRAERERLAKQAEEAAKREEEEQRLQEEREAQEPPADAPAPDQGAGVWGEGTSTPAPGESETPPTAPSSDTPEGAATPGVTPAPAADAPPPPDAPASAPSVGEPALASGVACTALGSCGSFTLECANDGVCREAGSPGTYGFGVGCMQSTDCGYGLVCTSSMCSHPTGDSSGTETPSEGQ